MTPVSGSRLLAPRSSLLTDRTMRFTNQIRPLLVGLPILVSQAFVVVQPVAGWEWNVFRSADTAPEATKRRPRRSPSSRRRRHVGRMEASSMPTDKAARTGGRSSTNGPHRSVAQWDVVRKRRDQFCQRK